MHYGAPANFTISVRNYFISKSMACSITEFKSSRFLQSLVEYNKEWDEELTFVPRLIDVILNICYSFAPIYLLVFFSVTDLV